jgi:hypothetical protein
LATKNHDVHLSYMQTLTHLMGTSTRVLLLLAVAAAVLAMQANASKTPVRGTLCSSVSAASCDVLLLLLQSRIPDKQPVLWSQAE